MTIARLLVVLLSISACQKDKDADTSSSTPPVRGPKVISAEVDAPYPLAPLTHRVTVETDVPTVLSVEWTNGDHTVTIAFDPESTTHEHVLLGWRPDSTYVATVMVADGEDTATVDVDVVTNPVPPYFPVAESVVDPTADIAPGHTLVAMRAPKINPAEGPTEAGLIFDEEGYLVWYIETQGSQDFKEFDGGLGGLVGTGVGFYGVYDWTGERLKWWTVSPAEAPGVEIAAQSAEIIHHDVMPIPGTNEFAALLRYPLDVPDYPSDYGDIDATAPRTIADDVVIHFDDSGTILSETRISDLIPTSRIGIDSLLETTEGWGDWAHANAVIWDDPTFIVSLRHQDAIVKIDPSIPEVVWILGTHANWPPSHTGYLLDPAPDVEWPYHSHAPMLKPGSAPGLPTLVLFDNGNFRASPFTGEVGSDPEDSYSRIAEFTVDESAGTVTQNWAWTFDDSTLVSGGHLFSAAVGDADYLDNGNVLSTWGYLDSQPNGSLSVDVGIGARSIRLVEIAPGEGDVWQLHLYTDEDINPFGWMGYRAERIGTLYGRVID